MTQPLPIEIVMLGLGAVLLLLQMFLQSVSSAIELGVGYKMGYRDDSRVVRSVIAGRADRAFRNLLETFPIFAALALALVVTGRNGGLGALGAQVWIVMRILHAYPLCAAVSDPDPVRAQRGLVRFDFCAGGDAGAAVPVVRMLT
jgi:uncharacterized MAPEG superfamily protein